MAGAKWIQFELSYTPIVVRYLIIKHHPELELKVTIKTKVPSGYYYSYLNDAIKEANEHYYLTHSHDN